MARAIHKRCCCPPESASAADYLGSTRGTVSQTLLSLEAKGLIVRQR
ncbi:MAG: hypothetical protein ABL973_09015 [Micropepsaceae bacterium]